ncbi:MAG: protein adenylyltransferase SelO [Burkholderiaceae bacterium]
MSFMPPLPPLAPHRPSRSAPVVSAAELGVAVAPGFAALPVTDDPPWFACDPTPLTDASLVSTSPGACAEVGLNPSVVMASPAWRTLLCAEATLAEQASYATVYAGHQFGVFVPRLGDGRALCLGQINGREFQLKGAGSTPYARHADGRAVLRSSVREYLCSEAMAALGIPTTRALSLAVSATPVFRERPEPAAVVCRTAPSFIRFGHFEYFASRGQIDTLRLLLDHLMPLDPALMDGAQPGQPSEQVEALVLNLAQRTAQLMADWTAVGFMHGVMNTDNFSVLGLTIDYGPFGFMEAFEPQHICNHSDDRGRYAFDQQPSIGLWNLQRLLLALWPAVSTPPPDRAAFDDLHDRMVGVYRASFDQAFQLHFKAKLGMDAQGLPQQEVDRLLGTLFDFMTRQRADFTRFFRATAHIEPGQGLSHVGWQPLLKSLGLPGEDRTWLEQYAALLTRPEALAGSGVAQWRQARRAKNPAYVLRNWMAESVIRALEDHADAAPLEAALGVLSSPFEDHPSHAAWREDTPDWAHGLCVSCSS